MAKTENVIGDDWNDVSPQQQLDANAFSVRPVLDPTIALEMAKGSALVQLQTKQIVNHHGATQMYLANKRLAKQFGLEKDDQDKYITPYPPGSTNNTIIVDNGLSEKLAGIVEKLTTPQKQEPVIVEAEDPAPIVVEPVKEPVREPVKEPVVVKEELSWWQKLSGKAWAAIIAAIAASGITLGTFGDWLWSWFSKPGEPGTIPAVVQPADREISGRIGVTIE